MKPLVLLCVVFTLAGCVSSQPYLADRYDIPAGMQRMDESHPTEQWTYLQQAGIIERGSDTLNLTRWPDATIGGITPIEGHVVFLVQQSNTSHAIASYHFIFATKGQATSYFEAMQAQGFTCTPQPEYHAHAFRQDNHLAFIFSNEAKDPIVNQAADALAGRMAGAIGVPDACAPK